MTTLQEALDGAIKYINSYAFADWQPVVMALHEAKATLAQPQGVCGQWAMSAHPAPSTSPEIEELKVRLEQAKDSRDFYKRRVEALQSCQSTMRDPERTMACDIIANGSLLMDGIGKPAALRYSAPAPVAQPAQGELEK